MVQLIFWDKLCSSSKQLMVLIKKKIKKDISKTLLSALFWLWEHRAQVEPKHSNIFEGKNLKENKINEFGNFWFFLRSLSFDMKGLYVQHVIWLWKHNCRHACLGCHRIPVEPMAAVRGRDESAGGFACESGAAESGSAAQCESHYRPTTFMALVERCRASSVSHWWTGMGVATAVGDGPHRWTPPLPLSAACKSKSPTLVVSVSQTHRLENSWVDHNYITRSFTSRTTAALRPQLSFFRFFKTPNDYTVGIIHRSRWMYFLVSPELLTKTLIFPQSFVNSFSISSVYTSAPMDKCDHTTTGSVMTPDDGTQEPVQLIGSNERPSCSFWLLIILCCLSQSGWQNIAHEVWNQVQVAVEVS